MSTCATLLLLFALPFSVLNAQEDRGTISGTVTDPGGAIVPNALVTAVQNETNVKYKTTSNDSGEFTIASLPVGNYRVSIEAVGFKTAIFDRGSLTGGGVLRLNARLEVGAVQQQIEVSAESASILQMDDTKIRNEIPYQLIQGLPTVVAGNMRSPGKPDAGCRGHRSGRAHRWRTAGCLGRNAGRRIGGRKSVGLRSVGGRMLTNGPSIPGEDGARARWYFANTKSPACPNGFGQEETIKAIWLADAEGAPSAGGVPRKE